MFEGHNITRYPPHRRAHRSGIARVFQRNALFKSMTVLDNVVAGSFLRHETRSLSGSSGTEFRTCAQAGRESSTRCMELLAFVGLEDKTHELCTNLPHGSQRELCVAVALASDPTLCSWTSRSPA